MPPSASSFTGRFGIAADNGDGTTTLYLGDGSSLSYRGNSVATVSGSASQAEVRFTPGQPPVVTSNTPVNVVVAPPPPGFTWVPTAGGTYDWTNTANWNPATVPNTVGGIAYKNINITGNQTVNVNTPVTLGEIVVGDSSGTQTTLLQKNTSGSFVMDQTENGAAYLTRTAGGTGTVTFGSDLNITLNDNLTVRLAGGSASSTMVIAGILSGSGKSLSKEGGSLTLSLAGANTYSGATRIQGGILSLDHSLAMQNSVLDTVNSITGDATNGLRTTVTSLTLGGLTGPKNLASMFTTTSGGYSGVTALTLDPETGAISELLRCHRQWSGGHDPHQDRPRHADALRVRTPTPEPPRFPPALSKSAAPASSAMAPTPETSPSAAARFSNTAAAPPRRWLGSISGSGALVKNTGSSALTLGGSNTSFTGSVTLNSGTLTLANTNALSAASALTLTGTSALKTSVQNATLNAPVNVSGTPEIHAPDFGTGSTVSTLTLGGAISGSGRCDLFIPLHRRLQLQANDPAQRAEQLHRRAPSSILPTTTPISSSSSASPTPCPLPRCSRSMASPAVAAAAPPSSISMDSTRRSVACKTHPRAA